MRAKGPANLDCPPEKKEVNARTFREEEGRGKNVLNKKAPINSEHGGEEGVK